MKSPQSIFKISAICNLYATIASIAFVAKAFFIVVPASQTIMHFSHYYHLLDKPIWQLTAEKYYNDNKKSVFFFLPLLLIWKPK